MTDTNDGNMDQDFETPRIVVCDLGELNWVKVEHDLILVNRRYVSETEKNRRG